MSTTNSTENRTITSPAADVIALESLRSKEFDGLLFDMDGTLIDSTASVERSWGAWAAREGIEGFSLEHGKPAVATVASFVPAERVEESVQFLIQLEITDTADVVALPGAVELTAALPRERWAIVTSSARELAFRRLAAAELPAPDVLVSFDDVELGKPHPEPFLLGAHTLGLDPSRCLAFEDTVAGLIAARKAGCTTIGVLGTHTEAELSPYADATVGSLTSVLAAFSAATLTVSGAAIG